MPLVEIVGLERAVVAVEHNLCVALENQGQGAARRADVDRLPQAVEHQHMLVQHGIHDRSNLHQTTENQLDCQRGAKSKRSKLPERVQGETGSSGPLGGPEPGAFRSAGATLAWTAGAFRDRSPVSLPPARCLEVCGSVRWSLASTGE